MQAIEAREILLPQSDHLLRIHPIIMQKSNRLLPTSHRTAPKELQDGIWVSKSITNGPLRPLSASHRSAVGRVHDGRDKILLPCAQVASATRVL